MKNDQLSRINYVRQQNSRPLLSKSECLTKAARTWSLNMATVDRLYHSPLAQTVEKNVAQIGGQNSVKTLDSVELYDNI